MTSYLPEVTSDGLVLWRLKRSPEEQFWCSVSEREGKLVLTLQSPSNTGMATSETHMDIGSLVDRSERLREQFSAVAWVAVDVDFDEPD